MNEVLIQGEGLNNYGGRGGGSSAIVIPLEYAFRGNKASETR